MVIGMLEIEEAKNMEVHEVEGRNRGAFYFPRGEA